jgi:hypothetical protein
MPYKLRKAPNRELFWVVNTDTGKKHSIQPIPRARAQRQMNLLRGIEHGFVPTKGYRSPVKGGAVQGGDCNTELHKTETLLNEFVAKTNTCADALRASNSRIRELTRMRGGGKSPKKDCCEELKVERRKLKLLEKEYIGDWK